MLELKLKASNDIDAEGKRVFLTDNTGNYLPDINEGGYSTPNKTRDSIAVFPIGNQITSKGIKIPIVFDNYDPQTATSWTAQIKTDGWLSFSLVYAPIVPNIVDLDSLNYTLNEVVYSASDYKLFKAVVDITSDLEGFIFVEAKPEDLLIFNNSKSLDQLFLANLSFLKIELNQKKIELLIDSENLSNLKKIKVIQEAYDRVRSIIQGAIYQYCIGNKYVAVRYVEFLLTNNYNQL